MSEKKIRLETVWLLADVFLTVTSTIRYVFPFFGVKTLSPLLVLALFTVTVQVESTTTGLPTVFVPDDDDGVVCDGGVVWSTGVVWSEVVVCKIVAGVLNALFTEFARRAPSRPIIPQVTSEMMTRPPITPSAIHRPVRRFFGVGGTGWGHCGGGGAYAG